jgi:hypothetical protein
MSAGAASANADSDSVLDASRRAQQEWEQCGLFWSPGEHTYCYSSFATIIDDAVADTPVAFKSALVADLFVCLVNSSCEQFKSTVLEQCYAPQIPPQSSQTCPLRTSPTSPPLTKTPPIQTLTRCTRYTQIHPNSITSHTGPLEGKTDFATVVSR